MNDNRTWEVRTTEDCRRVGLDATTSCIDIVGTAKLLLARGKLSPQEFSFIINSDRPVTRLIERCNRARIDYARFA